MEKRTHKLHNHPRAEKELGLTDEVIVDSEFSHLFTIVREYTSGHVIVDKQEFLNKAFINLLNTL